MIKLNDSVCLPESLEQMRFKTFRIFSEILSLKEVSEADYKLACSTVTVFYDFIFRLKGEMKDEKIL